MRTQITQKELDAQTVLRIPSRHYDTLRDVLKKAVRESQGNSQDAIIKAYAFLLANSYAVEVQP